MKPTSQQTAFQTRLGHEFADPSLLIRALTHASAVTEPRHSNERMEFLGDRVLGLVIAEALLSEDRKAAEGLIAPRFNALVRKETCADVARQIGMGDVLRLGKSEAMSGGRRKEALLGDAMEAMIAALYLDGGLDVARDRILALWGARIDEVEEDARDAKTALQEWAQARGEQPPTYETVGRKGPDHAPLFTIRVTIRDGRTAEADATSKRAAEQAAAQALLDEIDG